MTKPATAQKCRFFDTHGERGRKRRPRGFKPGNVSKKVHDPKGHRLIILHWLAKRGKPTWGDDIAKGVGLDLDDFWTAINGCWRWFHVVHGGWDLTAAGRRQVAANPRAVK